MTVTAEVTGLGDLVEACDRVSAVLADPATAADATRYLAEAGRPNVPRDTGALARSETVTATSTGAVLDYTVRYALPVHALRPWLPDAVAAAEPKILTLYADAATAAWY